MAVAIRKRQMRRKEHLRDKINKLTTKLGSKLAHNRELKAEIDHRRLARLPEGGAALGQCCVRHGVFRLITKVNDNLF